MKFLEKYIEDNNIKSYLSFDDIDNIKKYMTAEDMKKYEEQIGWNERVETLEDYIADLIMNCNYMFAVENEDINYLIHLIYGCEFDIEINEKGKINLIDMQGIYLGGVESYEDFEDIISASGRLSGSYYSDYYGIEVC